MAKSSLDVALPFPLPARHFRSGVRPPVASNKERTVTCTHPVCPDKDRAEVVRCSPRRSWLAVFSSLYIAAVGVALAFAAGSKQTVEPINSVMGAALHPATTLCLGAM
jgi:hypothetical protein